MPSTRYWHPSLRSHRNKRNKIINLKFPQGHPERSLPLILHSTRLSIKAGMTNWQNNTNQSNNFHFSYFFVVQRTSWMSMSHISTTTKRPLNVLQKMINFSTHRKRITGEQHRHNKPLIFLISLHVKKIKLSHNANKSWWPAYILSQAGRDSFADEPFHCMGRGKIQ